MIDPLAMGLIAIAVMLILSIAGVPVGIAMGTVAVVGLWITGGSAFALNVLTNLPFATASDYSFVVIPMFVLMGAIASASGITQELFGFSNLMLRSTRGALYQATILASAGFAAISGSTLVNAALFTRIALSEMLHLGYDRAYSAGCIAAAGTIAALDSALDQFRHLWSVDGRIRCRTAHRRCRARCSDGCGLHDRNKHSGQGSQGHRARAATASEIA